ncbi:TonB-dependent receptor [Sphingomonas sp.]|uniref:TonB-dependent receptor n=1 Tax=Sphingomonas sp. TaxID=28214 RepID=UPI003CC6D650
MKHLVLTTSVLALAVAAQPAWAQSATTAPQSSEPAQAGSPAAADPAAPAPAADQPATTEATDRAGAGLADIIVTAQRRSESAQRAAVAIAVVTPGVLTNAGVVTPTTLNAAVPALIVTKAGGANTSFFVRGVGNFTVNAYADPAIAFNVDGVYLGRPTSTTGTFFDLDRVEVLKGPQGTLYGRNATGGAVNVIPAKPILGEFSGYVRGGYGRFDAVDGEAAVNIPLGDRFAFRAAGKVVHDDGYNRDGTNDEVGQAVRLQLYGRLSDSLSVRIAADYSHQGGVGPGASFNGSLRYTPGSPATAASTANYTYIPANIPAYDGLHTARSQAYFRTLVIGGAFINPGTFPALGEFLKPGQAYAYPALDNDYRGILAEVSLDTGIGQFTFLPAYRKSTLDSVFNGPAFAAGINTEEDRQYSAELRLQGKTIGPIEWLIGGYYFDESIRAQYTFSQFQINVFQNIATGTKSVAGFGRIVANLTDRLRLVGGARYTRDRKRFDYVADTLVEICSRPPPPNGPGCFGGPSVTPARSLDQLPFAPIPMPNRGPVPFGTAGNLILDNQDSGNPREAFSRFTYRAAAEYDLGPASLLYVSYETGFRSGGFSASATYPTYQPEYITALTLGSKNRFLDNRLQVNVELFRWKYTNQQVSHFGFEASGATNLFTENIGRSTIQGVDFDTQLRATPTTLLRGSVQYLDNRIDRFAYTNPFGGTNLTPVTGCRVSAPASAAAQQVYTVDCAGQRGYNSPRWSFNAGGDQSFTVGDYRATLTGEVRYRSNRVIGFERLPQQNSGDDTTVDLSVTFGPADERWMLTGYVRNLFDVTAAAAAQFSGSTGNSISTNYYPRRSYGVRGSVKF